jgi:hypothetical protein
MSDVLAATAIQHKATALPCNCFVVFIESFLSLLSLRFLFLGANYIMQGISQATEAIDFSSKRKMTFFTAHFAASERRNVV